MSNAKIEGLKADLAAAEKEHAERALYPTWVKPHDSHISRTNGHVSVELYPQYHVDREGGVTVLVQDAADEARAIAEKPAAEEKKAEQPKDTEQTG